MLKGSCLCGDVRYETNASPQGPSMCHCGQCQKQSGGIWSSAYVPTDALTITGPVRWFEASAKAQRGFCPTCGSFLFWRGTGEGTTSFSLGSVDGPSGMTIEKHIFTADKGDYYTIADGVPQRT